MTMGGGPGRSLPRAAPSGPRDRHRGRLDRRTTPAVSLPAPGEPHTQQSIEVTGLAPGAPYGICVRAVDESDNMGGISNSIVHHAGPDEPPPPPPADETPPSAIDDLTAADVTETTAALVGQRRGTMETRAPPQFMNLACWPAARLSARQTGWPRLPSRSPCRSPLPQEPARPMVSSISFPARPTGSQCACGMKPAIRARLARRSPFRRPSRRRHLHPIPSRPLPSPISSWSRRGSTRLLWSGPPPGTMVASDERRTIGSASASMPPSPMNRSGNSPRRPTQPDSDVLLLPAQARDGPFEVSRRARTTLSRSARWMTPGS